MIMNMFCCDNENNYPYLIDSGVRFMNAQMLTDDEIKQFLNGE